jgi:hypothetical protein
MVRYRALGVGPSAPRVFVKVLIAYSVIPHQAARE